MKHPVLAGALGAGAVAGVVHAAPALCSVRAIRCRLVPDLAGIGASGHVALTFDDGPDPKSTPSFLEALDRLGWKATFFLLGSMTRKAPGLAAELVAAGHEVGVHGDVHRSMLERPPTAIAEDIRRALWTVGDASGVQPLWFRPPYGTLSTPALVAARRASLRTVLWTAWGRDWREQATPSSVVDDVRRGLGPGGTVLLHDSDCTSAPEAWRSALGALPRLAEVFEERGLTVGPLREHGIRTAA